MDGSAEDGEYHALHGSLDQTPWIPLAIERGVTGKLFTHRLMDTQGDPLSFNADAMTLMCTNAEKNAILTLMGKACYYIPLSHSAAGDTAGHATDRINIVLAIKAGGVQNIDPACTYWKVGIEINDNEVV